MARALQFSCKPVGLESRWHHAKSLSPKFKTCWQPQIWEFVFPLPVP